MVDQLTSGVNAPQLLCLKVTGEVVEGGFVLSCLSFFPHSAASGSSPGAGVAQKL